MKIGIRFGHMESGADSGAVGFLKETDVNREYGAHVITYLIRAGHEVINCTPKSANSMSDSLCQGVDIANNNSCDIFLSLHVNAGGGKGCEVLYYGNSEANKIIADRISNSISTICNYINRGGKSDVRGLYELKHTNMPAFIIEPFFCDSQDDCDKYKPELIAKAIVGGLLESMPKKEIQEPQEVKHWGQIPFDYINNNGIKINETRFDDKLTRAEFFAFEAQRMGWKP